MLFTLGDQSYDLGTFEYYFLKNSERPSADSAQIKIEEYLDLYINFRLKVLEAKNRNMDQDPAFIEELEGYKSQLAEPYLTATQYNDSLVMEAYERKKFEVSAAHILLRVDENALPADTLQVYNRLLDIKSEIEDGLDFSIAAKKYSQDPSARMNSGNLGYFSSLQMVYPFENAAYDNPVGSLVGPIKTRFGYHLLKVIDKRPARGQIKVAHIMIRNQSDSLAEEVKKKIFSIYENLQSGADWNEQCKIYSEDKSSAPKGGELNWFGTGALVPEFENVAFALENKGDYSEPVQTRFGWHIIKLIDKKPLPPLEEIRQELEARIKRDSRSKESKKEVLATLKKSQDFTLDSAVYKQAMAGIDSTIKFAKWTYDSTSTLLDQSIFSLKGGTYSVEDFYKFVVEAQRSRSNADLADYKNQLYERFESQSIMDAELAYLEQNNQDFKLILDEYESGILLFNLMEEEVWQKALEDTTGLSAFFEQNQSNYQANEMLEVRKLSAQDSLTLVKASQNLDLSNSQLDSLFNSQEALALQVDDLKVEKGEIAFLDTNWELGNHYQKEGNFYTLWVVKEVLPTRPLALNEVRGLAISDYQSHLEKLWVASLKEIYPYELNKKVLKRFVKTFD
ncbi:peptidylprolyl isomerase [Reichenbachiella ulvae]|uniref:Peptidylprolyl isomerase n=1 Tax=Reichenbachiella ulvae TaxID=2980104 RepID=A0ABT3CX00_9BACT|nr:peptidylprolyl isomerase [Reichenbachiella ulvae]MCV9388088.1 peptidylprolyl isomerase [Reichenbachiella ulvae]